MVEVTEWTYASDLKEWINEIIKENDLPFRRARVEEKEGEKRPDILLYDKNNNICMLIHCKRPEINPADTKFVADAIKYLDVFKELEIRHFITHNVNHLILWDSITLTIIDQFPITFIANLEGYTRKEDDIKEKWKRFLI